MTSPSDNSTSPISGGQYIRYGPPPVVPGHTLLRAIGRGSYGEVWLARDVIGMYRAVKVVYRSTFLEDGPYAREFEGIRKFAPVSLSHGSQVHILLINRNDQEGYFYYVMELADDAQPKGEDGRWKMEDGGQAPSEMAIPHPPSSIFDPQSYVPRTLDHDLKTRGRLPFAECLNTSHALADAVKHLHDNGLVHRDIKPSNIIFVNGIPKLADIGLVTGLDASLTYGSTQGFIAPEGAGRPQGDIYSLGKVIYEMWSGQDRLKSPELPPGWAEWPDREQVSELRAVSNRACEPETAKRYATADDLIKDLDLLKAGKSVRLLRMLQRGRRRALAAAVAVAVVGLVAATGVWFFGRAREQAQEREALVRDAQMLRVREPSHGWSSAALEKVGKAARIKMANDIRAEAAASFAGFDTKVLPVLTNYNYGADNLVFDGEGRRLLMDGGEKGQQARLWDTWSGEVKQFAESGRGPVWFGQDGRPRLLHAGQPGIYKVTSLEDGSEVPSFKFKAGSLDSQTNGLLRLVVSADGSLAAAAVDSVTNTADGLKARVGHLAVWQTESGTVLWERTEACTALAFSPDGDCIGVGDSDGGVQVHSLPEWGPVASFQVAAAVESVAFGRDPGQATGVVAKHPWLLAVGASGGTVWIHRLSPPSVKAICRGAHYNVFALAFASDGMTLISSGRNEPVVWDVATGRLLLRTDSADFGVALALSPDGRRIAIGTRKGFEPDRVRLLAVERDRGVKSFRGLSSASGKLAFSHDGQRLAALSDSGELGIWNLASNRLDHLLRAPVLSADNAALAFSRADNLFAFTTSGGAALRDLRTGIEKRWPLPQGSQEHLWFDSTGHLFLFQWEKRQVVVRDLSRTNCQEPLYPPFRPFDGRIFDSRLSNDGQVLAICGSRFTNSYTNHVLMVMNPQTGQLLRSLPAPNTGNGEDISLDASGRLLGYSNEATKRMDFFEIPSGRPSGHSDGLAAEASLGAVWLSLRTGYSDLMPGVRVWRRESPQRSLVLGAGLWGPARTEFSPDGRFIAWGITDGTVLVAEMAEVFQQVQQRGLGWR